MTRYSVAAVPGVEDDLARIWFSSTNRTAISQASNAIDRMLREDAPQKGEDAEHGLRQLVVPPLIAKFTINEGDRLVTIWSIQHIGTLTNGH